MFSKKTAVAAAALLAAFAAQAQVSVYGNLDLSVGSYNEPGPAKAVTAVQSGDMRESFLGFKGQEDLGGGLKAFFQLESALNADIGAASGGTSNFWSRASLIGLQGDFGTVTLGNTRSLGYLTNTAYNPFADSSLFSASQLLFGQDNWDNSVTYTSPNLSGFTAAVQVGFNETNNVDENLGLSLNYAAGPLGVGFFYEDNATGANTDRKEWQLAASYDFGVAKLFGQYGQEKVTAAKADKFFQIGASVPVTTAGTVLVSFGQDKIGGTNTKLREFSLAYDHSLSKRTGAYIGLNNSRNSGLTTAKSGTSVAAGIRHSF